MNRIYFVSISATLVIVHGLSDAMAEKDWVRMRPGDYGNETEFLNRFVFQEYERDQVYVTAYSREKNIYIGRYDVNGDGVSELFVFNTHSSWCGRTLGCALLA